MDLKKPTTRAECVDVPRPCPFVSCRYHLFFDVAKCRHGDRLIVRRGGRALLRWLNGCTMPPVAIESCALDVAEDGEHTEQQVASILGIKQQSVHETIQKACKKIKEKI